MKNTKFLTEAIQAFINGDESVAKDRMRKFFIESATEINKELEEQFDQNISEDIHADPSADFNEEIKYSLDEADDKPEEHQEDISSEETQEIQTGDDSIESSETVEVSKTGWEDILQAFDDFEAAFNEVSSEQSSEEVTGEFDEVEFGSELDESFKMKDVQEPQKTEKDGVNKTSPVAPNAKSPVEGVKPVKIDTKEDTTEGSTTYTTDDNNNVMNSDKDLMHDVKEPTNTAEKSNSILPKK